MHRALWQNDRNRAAKLHLKFTVLRQTPADAELTHGNSCERKALLDLVKKGEVVVAGRYYGLEYSYFGELRKLGASWVIRIRNNPRLEIVEELPLTDADRAGGVTWQAGHGTHPIIRDELRRVRRGHQAVSTSDNRSLIRPGGTAAKEVVGACRARISSATAKLREIAEDAEIREPFHARPSSRQRACQSVLPRSRTNARFLMQNFRLAQVVKPGLTALLSRRARGCGRCLSRLRLPGCCRRGHTSGRGWSKRAGRWAGG